MIWRYGLFALVLLLGVAAGVRDSVDGWIARTELPSVLAETSVEVRDRHGALLRVFPVEDGRMRMGVRVGDVDPDFLAMLIAYEDKRFYTHKGVDPLALVRAGMQALWHGEVVSGGSTLTMQVARLMENSGTGRWRGKLRQMRMALAMERRHSKDEILALYLVHAPYGGALEGVRAASLAWFGKEPRRLTQAEAALLVALPQAPEARRPDRNSRAAAKARARVLARVDAPDVVLNAPMPQAMRPFPRLAAHLSDHLRAETPAARRFDLTLDASVQRAMRALARRAVAGQAAGVWAAIVVAEHGSGAVRASVAAPWYQGRNAGFVDMTRATRSPGSTLKPLIYGLAFDQGLAHPDTVISDTPVAFGRYAPQNFDGQFRGDVTVRDALQMSLNIPPVRLTHALGPAHLMEALRRSGAEAQVPGGVPGLAVALGGVGLSLNDLVQIYGGLARGGTAQPLRWMREGALPELASAMSSAAAWQVGHILAGIAPPAGQGAQVGRIAYKTGTSYGHRDAWAIGFDGAHVIGVWLGRPDGTPVPGAFGGDLAAPVLFEAFGKLGVPLTRLPAPPPETLILSNAALPLPLQRFRTRDAAFRGQIDAPVVRFPPDGAVLRQGRDGVVMKLQSGRLPLTVLVDGAPYLTGLRRREVLLSVALSGFTQVKVIDASGRAATVAFQID
ncbi:penicillin-binding protein 1C [Sulfitobacter sp. JB4-11]|uniref:penicillin-binding protein 1C n=1 Tax=Sulfitobacter rhodophyticola TaxID=3238304 RepID=UPI003511E349